MFFAPPAVKSLSKYSEYGSHIGNRDFLIMLAIAIALHAVSFGLYSMSPHEKATIIPVRVLNIKLNSGLAGEELQMPPPATMPGAQPTPVSMTLQDAAIVAQPLPEKSLQASANKKYVSNSHKPLIEILSNEKLQRKPDNNLFRDRNIFAKPKKYVRESEMGYLDKDGKLRGNGTNIAGSKEGQEIATKYEQEISLWVTKYHIYPPAAKQQHVEGNAIVRIRINRDGHIIYSKIDTSSGSALLDQAALQMVYNSDPVPHVPDNYPTGRELEFLIPIGFSLNSLNN